MTFIDSSKQRKKIRNKISKEKSGLETVLLNYNKISPKPLSNFNDILNGKFPWNDESETCDKGSTIQTGSPYLTFRCLSSK